VIFPNGLKGWLKKQNNKKAIMKRIILNNQTIVLYDEITEGSIVGFVDSGGIRGFIMPAFEELTKQNGYKAFSERLFFGHDNAGVFAWKTMKFSTNIQQVLFQIDTAEIYVFKNSRHLFSWMSDRILHIGTKKVTVSDNFVLVKNIEDSDIVGVINAKGRKGVYRHVFSNEDNIEHYRAIFFANKDEYDVETEELIGKKTYESIRTALINNEDDIKEAYLFKTDHELIKWLSKDI